MTRPCKSYLQLISENKSHRTKAELELRKNGEEALLSNVKIKEFQEVKRNNIAHKEFKRVVRLLGNIEKNDDLFAGPINRYCLLKAECNEFLEKRETFYNNLKELDDLIPEERDMSMTDYYNLKMKLQNQILALDKQLQTKRKMMFDIEKENLMTIAGALRSIPKTPSKEEDDDDDLFN